MSAHPVQTSSPRAAAERFVGRAVRRTEDRRFVTGRGCVVRELPLSATDIARWIRDARHEG